MVPQAFSDAWGTTNFSPTLHWPMPPSDKGPKPVPPSREAKLAEALRANLRRRKAGAASKTPPLAKPKSVDET